MRLAKIFIRYYRLNFVEGGAKLVQDGQVSYCYVLRTIDQDRLPNFQVLFYSILSLVLLLVGL